MGIQVGPLPSLGVQEGPTCEYLNFMPRYRYRGIKVLASGTPTYPTLGVQEGPTICCEYLNLMPIKDTDTGALNKGT